LSNNTFKWQTVGSGVLVNANEGLSLSGTTAQLGQLFNQAGNPSAFSTSREIYTGSNLANLFKIRGSSTNKYFLINHGDNDGVFRFVNDALLETILYSEGYDYGWVRNHIRNNWSNDGVHGYGSAGSGLLISNSSANGASGIAQLLLGFPGNSFASDLLLFRTTGAGGMRITADAGLITFTTGFAGAGEFARFTGTSTRRFGIGTGATVDTTLHVAGDLKFVTGNQGAGKILTSDAAGVADWATLAAVVTADNGLTKNTSSNVRLGGTLVQTTTIDATSLYKLNITGTIAAEIFNVTNSGSGGSGIKGIATNGGVGVWAESTGGSGVYGQTNDTFGVYGAATTSGFGGFFSAQTSYGILAQSVSGYSGGFKLDSPNTNTVEPVVNIIRIADSSTSNGVGASLDYSIATNLGTEQVANRLISKWTNATDATRTSEFSITGVSSAASSTLFTLSGSGALKLNKYGVGTFTGTPAYTLQVDSSGNIIEGTVGSSFTPVVIGSSAANGTLTLEGNNAGAGNTATNANIIFKSGDTPTQAMDILNNGLVRIGSAPATTSGYGLVVDQPNDGASNIGIKVSANNHTAFMGIGYDKISSAGVLKIEGNGGLQYLGASSAVKINITSSGLAFFGGSSTPASTVEVGGSFATKLSTSAVNVTLDATHSTMLLTASGKTATLPTAVGITGRIYTIKLTVSGTGTVATTSSQTIDGSTTYSLSSQYKYVSVQSDGANWHIIANN
jgi:hypothetical protein